MNREEGSKHKPEKTVLSLRSRLWGGSYKNLVKVSSTCPPPREVDAETPVEHEALKTSQGAFTRGKYDNFIRAGLPDNIPPPLKNFQGDFTKGKYDNFGHTGPPDNIPPTPDNS